MNGEFRLRVCYSKSGRLRWLSHLEVLRCVERTIRRAAPPYAVTQGFSPHMKLAFGPALPVGTAGESEYFDVWLKEYTTPQEALERLSAAAPPDLRIVEVRYAGDREPSLTAALVIARYRCHVRGEEVDGEVLHAALVQLLEDGTLKVEHKGKTKIFDLARSLPKEPRVDVVEGETFIEMVVRMGPEGSLRPEQLVHAALSKAGIHASAVRTTRLDTLLENEGGWSRPV